MKTRTVQVFVQALLGLSSVSLAPAQTPSVPSAYQDLYSSLQTQLSSFDSQTKAGWNGTVTPVLFAGGLITANGNAGASLLAANKIKGVEAELSRLAGLGTKAVTVSIGFPLFYQPFFDFNGTSNQYGEFVTFYQSVVAAAHKHGLLVIVESGTLFPGFYSTGSGFNLSAYYATLSSSAYAAGRAAAAANIAATLHPDFLSVGSEPDNEAALTGQTSVGTPSGYASMVAQIVRAVRSAGSLVPVGAGVGTWLSSGSSFVSALATTGINYVDLHVYPISADFLPNLVAWSDQAKSLGLPVATTEAWMLKERDSEFSQFETGTDPTIFSRDAFSFWSPEDQLFLQTMANYANWKGSLFISPFWSKYFWAYLDYSQVANLTPAQIVDASNQASATAIVSGAITDTGTAYGKMIAAPQADAIAIALSSASFVSTALSPGAISSVFAINIAGGAASSPLPLQTSLNGVSVTVTDHTGTQATALLYSVGASQVNLVIPDNLATGWAKLTVHTAAAGIEEANILLNNTAPAVFTASQSGSGPAAAIFIVAHADGTSTSTLVANCPAGATCSAVPLSLGSSSDQAFLALYCSGIRAHHSGVSVIVGGTTIPAIFAGPQSQYPGMDQVNIPLPKSLAGAGLVNVQMLVDGAYSNTVQIQIQ